MKNFLLIAFIFVMGACSKKNDQPVAYASVDVLSAAVVNNILEVHVNVQQSALMTECNLVIYRSTPTDVTYRYTITLKDGPQTVLCNKWTLVSPLKYQIEYKMTSGSHQFGDLMSLNY
jgi:hypothetical protein